MLVSVFIVRVGDGEDGDRAKKSHALLPSSLHLAEKG